MASPSEPFFKSCKKAAWNLFWFAVAFGPPFHCLDSGLKFRPQISASNFVAPPTEKRKKIFKPLLFHSRRRKNKCVTVFLNYTRRNRIYDKNGFGKSCSLSLSRHISEICQKKRKLFSPLRVFHFFCCTTNFTSKINKPYSALFFLIPSLQLIQRHINLKYRHINWSSVT
jgi:hypothetical protein